MPDRKNTPKVSHSDPLSARARRLSSDSLPELGVAFVAGVDAEPAVAAGVAIAPVASAAGKLTSTVRVVGG